MQAQADAAKAEVVKLGEVAREKDVRTLVASLKEAGRITPAQEERVSKLLLSMAATGEVARFKEADGKEVAHSQLSLAKAIFLEWPRQVAIHDEWTPGSPAAIVTPGGDVPAETFMTIKTRGGEQRLPVRDADIAQKADALQAEAAKQGKTLDYGEAMKQAYAVLRTPA